MATKAVICCFQEEPVRQCPNGGQAPQRDEEFHQTLVVPKHIFDVNAVTEMKLTFCCPLWA